MGVLQVTLDVAEHILAWSGDVLRVEGLPAEGGGAEAVGGGVFGVDTHE